MTEFLEYPVHRFGCHDLPSATQELLIILKLSSFLSLALDLGISQSLWYASRSIVYSGSLQEMTKYRHCALIRSSFTFLKRTYIEGSGNVWSSLCTLYPNEW